VLRVYGMAAIGAGRPAPAVLLVRVPRPQARPPARHLRAVGLRLSAKAPGQRRALIPLSRLAQRHPLAVLSDADAEHLLPAWNAPASSAT
jgi:hypothetical protein